jgi:putative redox protein
MDVVSILKKRRSPFTGLKICLSGVRAGGYPRRYTHIRIDFVVYGSGAKPCDVERAIALSMTRYCSAVASLNADFAHTFRIVEDKRGMMKVTGSISSGLACHKYPPSNQ